MLLQLEMLARLSGAINSTFLDAVIVLLILAYFTYILRALYGALVCVGGCSRTPSLFPAWEQVYCLMLLCIAVSLMLQVDLRAILAGPTGAMRDFGTRAQHGAAPRKRHSVSRAWNLFDPSAVKFARSDRVKKITTGKPIEELAIARQGGQPHTRST